MDGSLNDGVSAYQRADYQEAMRLLKPMAEAGEAKAQYIIGDMYGYGRGAPQSWVEGVKWYRKAADQGFAKAEDELAVKYDLGWGVSEDHAEAERWAQRAFGHYLSGGERRR
jgi:TPR repeat protein